MPSAEISSCTLYLEPVTASIASQGALYSMLSPWAIVKGVDFPKFHKSGVLKGYAFVKLSSEAEMQTVCKALSPNKVHTTLQALAQNVTVLGQWKAYFAELRERVLPQLMVLSHSSWSSRKRLWSDAQHRRAQQVSSIAGCLARIWGLPPDGLPHAAVRSRLAELGRVAYLDYPGSSDARVQHTYPPPAPAPVLTVSRAVPVQHSASDSGTPVPKIPPGQALVRFLSAVDRSDALYCCRHMPLLVNGHRLHLLPTSAAEETQYIQTAAAKQAAKANMSWPDTAGGSSTGSAPTAQHTSTRSPSTGSAPTAQHTSTRSPTTSPLSVQHPTRVGGGKRQRSQSGSPPAGRSKVPAHALSPGAAARAHAHCDEM